MKLHFLSGGRVRMRRAVYYPGAAREERMDLPVSCALIRHDQGNVLFDTGCSPQAAIDPEARWGGLTRVMAPIFAPEDAVTGQLALAGLGADDIDLVICSHLHADHCGCNEAFAKATILCHADELAAARAPDGVQLGYLPADWDHPQSFDTFTGHRDVFGDGRITVMHTPGHTPGMSVALVTLDEAGPMLLASDAIAIEAHLTEAYAPKNSWDHALAVAAITDIKRIADEAHARIIYGHDATQWQALRKGAQFYR